MKTIITTLTLLLVFGTVVYAQHFEGIATYKTDRKVNLSVNERMDDATMESIQAQLKKQFQQEYTLQFDGGESLYVQVQNLEKPSPKAAAGGVQIVIAGDDNTLYRNIEAKTYRNQTEIMSKPFLVRDTLQKPEWVLEKESKNIGNYTCFKATFTDEVTERSLDSEGKEDSITRMRTTTAWYTLDIPVAHGPAEYWGLPGLILEVNDGDLTILCSKIVLSPKDGVTISVPDKGKEVTQAEFDGIQQKKTDEMMERFKGDGRRGDGRQVQLRIGG